jgi:HSP20 family protein
MTWRRDAFGDLWSELARVQGDVEKLFSRRSAGLPVNLWADDHAVYAELDLPAIDPEKLEVSLREGTKLTIKAVRPEPILDGASWIRQERPAGEFSRELTLPVLVNVDEIEAQYEHGVLSLKLPKSEAVKPRKIAVKI